MFKMHGEVVLIELFEGKAGARDGGGKVRFSPPPSEPFWKKSNTYYLTAMGKKYSIRISVEEPKNKSDQVQSPFRKHVFFQAKMKLYVSALHFGLMVDPVSMMPMHTARPLQRPDGSSVPDDLTFLVDLERRKITVTFKVKFEDPRSRGSTDYASESVIGKYDRINKYMFQIPFDRLTKIQQVTADKGHVLVISLNSPPQFFRKREDERACHGNEANLWTEFDSWYRQTDIVYDPYHLQRAPITLHKERPVIDIGKCSSVLPRLFSDICRSVDNICLRLGEYLQQR